MHTNLALCLKSLQPLIYTDFLNLQSWSDNVEDRVLLSLDAHNAFDNIEWSYLWAVMRKFGEPKLLYHDSKAVIREAGRLSPCFDLHRGTRQGCPISPLLFALAIQPMVALIRANPRICGFKYGELHEKLMLYMNDTILLLAMAVITKFGTYLGLAINWSKSSLMTLDRKSAPLSTQTNIPIFDSFKYLGIHLTPRLLDYIHLNLMPLLACLRDKVRI